MEQRSRIIIFSQVETDIWNNIGIVVQIMEAVRSEKIPKATAIRQIEANYKMSHFLFQTTCGKEISRVSHQ